MGRKILSIASVLCAIAAFLCAGSLFLMSPAGVVIDDVMLSTCVSDLFAVLVLLKFVPETTHDVVFDIRRPRVASHVFAVAICAVAWFVGVLLSTWVSTNVTDVVYTGTYANVNASPFGTMLLSLAVAPLCEELLIRGFCLSRLRESFSDAFAVIVSSVCFAVMHGTWTHLPLTFLLGLVLGGLRVSGLSLLRCMCLHSFANFCSLFVAAGLSVSPWMVSAPFVWVVYAVAALFAILAVVGKWYKAVV